MDDLSAENSNWIVESKFAPNRPNIDLVYRHRLIERLDAATRGKVILVVAPAGFGKSTILYQWNKSWTDAGKIFAWLALDDGDTEVQQFLSYCILSLATAGADVGQLEVAARNGLAGSNPTAVLSNLMQSISTQQRECLLILDDLHHIESEDTIEFVEQMVRQAPPNFTLVITTRQSPKMDMPILIAAGDATEIGPEQLRLTKDEAISALGDAISLEDAKEIFDQTEGWPVAVQLARVQKQAQPKTPIRAGGPSNLVAAYLTDQVLASVDEELREFLYTVCVLEQFNPPLADAVRQRQNSWEMLQKLDPLSALLVPTNVEGTWVRLHHLFAEYLLDTLKKQSPEKIPAIQSAASAWFAKHGQLIAAVKYASMAEEDAKVEQLILQAGGWSVILTEGINVMRALLRYAPDNVVLRSGRLMLARAYLCIKDGEYDRARSTFDASETLRSTSDSTDYDRDHRLVSSMVKAYEDNSEWAEPIVSRDFAAEMDQWSPLEAATLLCEKVMALFSVGLLEQAQHNLDLAVGQMRHSGSVLGLNYCYIHAGVLAIYNANFDLAKANIAQALELAENNFGEDSGLKHLAKLLEFSLRVWTGKADREDIEPFSRALTHVSEYDGWTEIYLVGLDSIFHLCVQCGEPAFAAEITEKMLQLASNRKLERLQRQATILKMRAAYLRGHVNEAKTIGAEVDQWVNSHELQENCRDWQSHYLAASELSTSRLIAPSHGQNLLRQSVGDSQQRQARFFHIRLLVSGAILQFQLGKRPAAAKCLIEALKKAMARNIVGPFLGDATLYQLLKTAKTSLRQQHSDLILANFVSDILTRYNELKPQSDGDMLSSREQEIIEQLAEGRSNKEIARRFELTENTVKFHLKNIYNKLAVNSRTQAIAAARKHQIVE